MMMEPHLAWIRLDPVATLDHLQTDTKALEAALAMKPKEYLVVIDHVSAVLVLASVFVTHLTAACGLPRIRA